MFRQTTSEEIRARGNEAYKRATTSEGLAPCVKRSRFEEALRLYRQALNAAVNEDESASCHKNMAVVYQKLAEPLLPKPKEDVKYLAWTVKEATSSFHESLRCGACVKPATWIASVRSSFCLFLTETAESLTRNLSRDERIPILTDLSANLHPQHLPSLKKLDGAAEIHRELADALFKDSLDIVKDAATKNTSVSSVLYGKCLAKLLDCYRPLELARVFAESHQVQMEIEDLREQVFIQQCICESVNARLAADDLLVATLSQDEELNMDAVFHVLDLYKEAIVLAREVETECEARAVSGLAKVYEKVLRMEDKAHAYYLNCIQLANSMAPRCFYAEPWHQEAVKSVESYRLARLKQEEAKHEKERQPWLESLKEELAELKSTSKKGLAALLTYLYTKHPPKKESHKIGSLLPDDLKKTCQKAIVHYHPDKQDSKDMKWKVHCEEIVKYLTAKYETMKVDTSVPIP